MPTVKVTTSKTLELAQKEALCLELSSAVAGILGKPEAYVQVLVSDDATISFGGSFSVPSAFVAVLSVGEFAPGATRKLSAALGAIFERFGIPPDRLYISFFARRGEEWGWNNTTF
ncbi:MAG: ABC transporter substrate-binding protein [Lentisphaeria bacterium]|nr:ABC transporter substrate-binding protein [Lentisphaeria bacterium]